jgi:peptide/nickel transport system ATP-binding protein
MSHAVEIENLTVTFQSGRGDVRAVDGVSLALPQGQVMALLGESGSGKSVTLRSLLRLHAPKRTRVTGAIRVAGRDVLALSRDDLADFRGGTVSMIFQEPMLALDPVYTVGQQIIEAIRRHEAISTADARARVGGRV